MSYRLCAFLLSSTFNWFASLIRPTAEVWKGGTLTRFLHCPISPPRHGTGSACMPYAYNGLRPEIHMILGKFSATIGGWKDTVIAGSLRKLSNARRKMGATVFGQVRNTFLSAVRPLCRPVGKAGLSADLAPRTACSQWPSDLVAIGRDFWLVDGRTFPTGVAEAGP